MSVILQNLPTEVQQHIVYMLTDQQDLLRLSLVSKLYYQLAIKSLYSKIYINDSRIEQSTVWPLAPSWTWLPLSEDSNNDGETAEADRKFACLLRSLRENKELCNSVIHVRLNWDIAIGLQARFIALLTTHSKSLRVLENITHPVLNDNLMGNKYTANLTSLDLPPPNTLPFIEIDEVYLPRLQETLANRMKLAQTGVIKNLTVFLDPVILFNKVVKLQRKLEIESFRMHCRADAYHSSIYTRLEQKEMKDLFDVKYLKELTVISWYDQSFVPDKIFKFDQWCEFRNLQDITLIAVTYDDELISKMIRNCFCLKRLKLDFAQPQREVSSDSLIYQSIFNHTKTLRFLDLKLNILNKIINLDLRNLDIVVRVLCPCENCQTRVLKEIFHGKILPLESDFKITNNNFHHFTNIDYFTSFSTSSLSPYSKAVDRFPSVRTGPGTVDEFLAIFNDQNSDRPHFVPLTISDFYALNQCLIHNMKLDMEPFASKFINLKFMVLNDISFIFEDNDPAIGRYPKPLFYNEGFNTNFNLNFDVDNVVRDLNDQRHAMFYLT